jgi:hypothetical protein
MDISLAYIVQPVSLYLTSEKDLDQLLKNGWERVRVMAVCFIDGFTTTYAISAYYH